jgi:nicotinamidase-related amidase
MTPIDRAHSALLVMDYQDAILKMLGEPAALAVEHASTIIKAARSAGVHVIYVCLGFRPGYPEANPRNERFAQIAKTGLFVTKTPGDDVHPALAPQPGDTVVIKHRVGAFAGTDLDLILRAKSIDTLVISGISTTGIVLSTVRYAADLDYRLVVIEDACADGKPEVHRLVMDEVISKQATVVSSAAFAASLAT